MADAKQLIARRRRPAGRRRADRTTPPKRIADDPRVGRRAAEGIAAFLEKRKPAWLRG